MSRLSSLKALFKEADKKYPSKRGRPKKVKRTMPTHPCIRCGKPIQGKSTKKKYCNECKLKHRISFSLTDAEYELFKNYYNIFGCDSVGSCAKDIVMSEVKQ